MQSEYSDEELDAAVVGNIQGELITSRQFPLSVSLHH